MLAATACRVAIVMPSPGSTTKKQLAQITLPSVNAPLESRYASGPVLNMRLCLPPILVPLWLCVSCWSPEGSQREVDDRIYPILEEASETVTGVRKTMPIERPLETLRRRLLEEPDAVVQLSLQEALDVAAENSREFQRQKEQLYLAALDLTRVHRDFELRFSGVLSADLNGQGRDTRADLSLGEDLGAAVNSTAGTRVLAGFVSTFLKSVLNGGAFDGSAILDLSITQPLLRGSGRRIAREPLTQAERNVIYQMRAFERFRATFATQVVSDYYSVVQQMQNLTNVEANYESVRQSRQRTEKEFEASRKTISDLGRERQSELSASNNRVRAQNQLETALDRFKLTLGLPVTARVGLDIAELRKLEQRGVEPFELDEKYAVAMALDRRLDHRTVLDQVEDAARKLAVAEDALRLGLSIGASIAVPSKDGNSIEPDWSRVNWAAGFDLDLALDRFAERNNYRSALVTLEVQIRAREQSQDSVQSQVRAALRNIRTAFDSYQIQVEAEKVADLRVASTTELYAAGRTNALDVLDAKDSLLSSQISLTAAIVDYAIAKLELLRDLEGLDLEPQGLRFDPALVAPAPGAAEENP
jgi:outer membrane protein TolC